MKSDKVIALEITLLPYFEILTLQGTNMMVVIITCRVEATLATSASNSFESLKHERAYV
jgi:hypothetical protein